MSGAIFACFRESLPVRYSQGRSGSTGRFPSLLMLGTIRGETLEAQGEELNVLLILVEGTERPPDGNKYHQPLSLLACDFVSHNTVTYIKAIRNTLRASMVQPP